MLEHITSVIFDLDGTLVDSMGVWGEIDIAYLGELGYEVPGDLQGNIEGMSFTETAAYFKERFLIPHTVEEIKQQWQDMAMDQYRHHISLKPGAAEFLPWLKERGITMGVASSNHLPLIEAVLGNHGIRSCFDCIITACDVKKGKPAPDVYLEAARQLGSAPENCLVFEDIVPGILAGKNAGMSVCAVRDDYSLHQEKEKRALADYYIYSYRQVMTGTYEEGIQVMTGTYEEGFR